MTTLENEFLRITIRSKGAELTSFFNKATNTELLWQADPNVWGWYGPNLFPVVGACLNNELQVNGKTYPMERHGFARHTEFELLQSTGTHALFSLRYSEKILGVYPYRFEFQIEYTLENQQLHIVYRVRNEDEKTVYFSVGAHPAFNIPFFANEDYTDYYIEFDAKEDLHTHLLADSGHFNGQTAPVTLTDRKLSLTKSLFDHDALVFKDLLSRQVKIGGKNHAHHIIVSYPDFNYLGIWAKPGASFVCIEPWLGCADTVGKLVSIEGKEDIQHVNPGKIFEATFSIGVYG